MKKLWTKYKETVFSNCTRPSHKATDLHFWRDHLFAATIAYLLPLSLIALFPGVYLAILQNLVFLLAADLFGILSLFIIAFVPGLLITHRKVLFIVAFYAISVALLYYLGMFGPGLLFLFAITVFTVLIYDSRVGLISVLINTILCILAGFAIEFDWGETPLTQVYDLQSWIAVSSNLVFLSALAALLIPRLFNGLQQTIDEQQRLSNALETKKEELEDSLDLLSEKNQELENFALVTSHDLREPLRMITSFLSLLKTNYSHKLDEKANKYIHFAVDGASRMSHMINEILEYSRLGRFNVEFKEINTNQLVDQVINQITLLSKDKNAEVSRSDLPNVKGSAVTLNLLFQNLLENALKYSRENVKPEIYINGKESEREWQFSITDNGTGIEEKYHEDIFLMFKRFQKNINTEGSGMGLAICKKIVELHGGRIWVTSAEGEGSIFTFSIKK